MFVWGSHAFATFSAHAVRKVGVDTMPEYLMTLYHFTLQALICSIIDVLYYPEAGYDVGPRVEASHTVLPEGWL